MDSFESLKSSLAAFDRDLPGRLRTIPGEQLSIERARLVDGAVRAFFESLGLRVGTILFARSGFPYTGVVGQDSDGDGFSSTGSYRDRPASLSRNSFRYPATVTLDTSAAYDLKLAGTNRVEIRFDVFNLLNRKNISTYNNIIGLNPSAPPGACSDRLRSAGFRAPDRPFRAPPHRGRREPRWLVR